MKNEVNAFDEMKLYGWSATGNFFFIHALRHATIINNIF